MTSSNDLELVLDKRIASISSFEVCPSVAHALLQHYRWDEERLIDQFWADSIKTVKDAGVHARYTSSKDHDNARSTLTDSTLSTEMECSICYDAFPAKTMLQMPCKHPFCPDCWT